MTKIISILCLLIYSYAFPAAADDPAKHYLSTLTAGVSTVSVEELRQMLAEDTNEVVLLDVRTFYERDQTRTISGDQEIHIPRGFLEIKAWDAVPKNKTIVVYCSKGTRSMLAVKTLNDMGWSRASSLEGGVKAWYESAGEACDCLPESREIPVRTPQNNGECKP